MSQICCLFICPFNFVQWLFSNNKVVLWLSIRSFETTARISRRMKKWNQCMAFFERHLCSSWNQLSRRQLFFDVSGYGGRRGPRVVSFISSVRQGVCALAFESIASWIFPRLRFALEETVEAQEVEDLYHADKTQAEAQAQQSTHGSCKKLKVNNDFI